MEQLQKEFRIAMIIFYVLSVLLLMYAGASSGVEEIRGSKLGAKMMWSFFDYPALISFYTGMFYTILWLTVKLIRKRTSK